MATRSGTAAKGFTTPRTIRPGRKAAPAGQDVDTGQDLTRLSTPTFNQAVDTYLALNQVGDAIRMAVRQMGTVGTAHFNLIEMALTGWKAKAYSGVDNTLDESGQILLESVIANLNNVNDYSFGFDDKVGLDRILEQLINDVITTGGCGAELVLDKARQPERVATFPYDSITWRQGSQSRYPVQAGDGEEVELNFPTVFVADFHRFVNEVYANPMFEAALREGRAYEQFLQDMRRAVKRSGHSRLTVTLDYARIKEVAPTELLASDKTKELDEWMEGVRSGVEDIVEDLAPEDAFVTYDVAKADVLKTDTEKSEYVSLMNAMSGNLATALKSNPSILGLRIEGSQSLSNTESLIYIKVAQAVRRPIEEIASRLLTLACRLYGMDIYVKFKFDPINLRPEDELAAFNTMKMDQDLTLLSMGFITDLEFSVRQGIGTLPKGYEPKSGTMFHEKKPVDASKASPNDGAQERALQPDTPDKAGGDSQ